VFSRGAIFSFFLAGIPTVAATRIYVPRFLARTLYANAYRGSEVIIAAARGSSALPQISQELRARGCAGVHTMEFDANCGGVDWPAERQKLLKRLLDTARIAGPGEIYLLSASVSQERVLSIQSGLRLVPRAVYVVPAEATANLFGLPMRRVGHSIAIETQRVPMASFARGTKRALDIAVAAFVLCLLAPAFIVIAAAIKLDSSGPVFFQQRRNGYRGREFRIVKFRTMTVQEDGDAVTQARRDDQRVTRVGRWLRKTSFDELPQLLNILRGEMSLVGPRPHAVAHDELYAKLIENYELRQHVKPGVTGWAQVNGLRGETPTVDLMFRRIEFDLWYAANSSVALDLQILARTVSAVLRQDNAY
jgi:Undecaprenyl-phosphate glucose phosphotransferase